MKLNRRRFLQYTWVGTGSILLPHKVLADWRKAAFSAESIEDVLLALFNQPNLLEEDAPITIIAPDKAEQGAFVPIAVNIQLPQIKSLTVLAEKNPLPLIAHFQFSDNMEGFIKTRIKLARSGHIIAIAHTGEGQFVARKQVEVMDESCD